MSPAVRCATLMRTHWALGPPVLEAKDEIKADAHHFGRRGRADTLCTNLNGQRLRFGSIGPSTHQERRCGALRHTLRRAGAPTRLILNFPGARFGTPVFGVTPRLAKGRLFRHTVRSGLRKRPP